MNAALEVLACGPATSVQDGGRIGWRRYGVSTAGAMDLAALALANALAGNGREAAAVELALAGGRFRVAGAALVVAAAGAVTLRVAGRQVAPGRGARARPGEVVEVGPPRGGVYGYLAVSGGLATPPEMGSRSLHRRSGLGGRPLAPGDLLPCGGQAGAVPRTLAALPAPAAGPIRVVPGPQDEQFTPEARHDFLSRDWVVQPGSDRMGLRLAGPLLAHLGGANIVSDGVLAGSVQVPGDGQPIVLMRDCQTTGGYPKIATVISADLGRLAQIAPGGALRFAAVTPAEAVAAARAFRAGLDRLAAARPLAETPAAEDLLSLNLVGGVVDARAAED